METLYHSLKQFGRVKTNEPLSKHTTFKIGGPADFFVSVDAVEKAVALFQYLDGEGISYVVMGGGSNMLVCDEGLRGVVIKIQDTRLLRQLADTDGQARNKIPAFAPLRTGKQDSVLEVSAGCVTVAMAQESIKAGLTGFEWGVGVPGTIGGAVRGNAGAMGGEMKDVVEKVEIYKDGEVFEWSNAQCGFGYRESEIKRNGGVVLRVWLALRHGEPDLHGMKKAMEHLQYRNKTQPQGFASTGCIFKNVDVGKPAFAPLRTDKQETRNKRQEIRLRSATDGQARNDKLLAHFDERDEMVQQFLRVGKISAGWLVEQAGLKGRQVGKALVSERHGNFIVNLGGATAADVLALIDEIKEKVYDRYEIELEEEIQII